MAKLGIAIVSAIVLGPIVNIIGMKETAALVFVPLFNTFLNVLKAISTPMIFLTVCWGIINIGDLYTLGRIGKKLITRLVSGTFAVSILAALCLAWLFPISFVEENALGNGFSDICKMILDIIPGDVVTPFQSGNTLQVIFLAICVGIGLLVLGDRVSETQKVVGQFNEVVQLLMETVSKLIPVFVFLSVYNLIQADFSSSISGVFKTLIISLAGTTLSITIYVLIISFYFKVSPKMLLLKLFPTWLIAFFNSIKFCCFCNKS